MDLEDQFRKKYKKWNIQNQLNFNWYQYITPIELSFSFELFSFELFSLPESLFELSSD